MTEGSQKSKTQVFFFQFSVDEQGCFPPCCLTQDQTKVEVVKIMATSFQGPRQTLLHSVPPTLQQYTVDPHLCQGLLDTHREVWVSPLWGPCSFLPGPGAHQVLFVPSKSPFPQSCVSSVVKSHWSPHSNSLGGSQFPCQIPRLVNLLWVLELS